MITGSCSSSFVSTFTSLVSTISTFSTLVYIAEGVGVSRSAFTITLVSSKVDSVNLGVSSVIFSGEADFTGA